MIAVGTIDTVARTAWGEARGCGVIGLTAVINVISNRASHPSWWGSDLVSVCLEPFQFSCRNDDDPNRAKLLAVTEADPWFSIAMALAERAASGKLSDVTKGADSYYARSMFPPTWAARAVETYEDGCHVFCRVTSATTKTNKPAAPNLSRYMTADQLNAAELDELR